MTFATQTLGHHPLGLTPIQVELEPPPGGQLLQGKATADEVERTGGAPQIQPGQGLAAIHRGGWRQVLGRSASFAAAGSVLHHYAAGSVLHD
jgi:hypothetical protein